MSYLGNATVMLAAGFGVPMLAALNAALGRYIGAPAVAAVALFCVALVVTVITAAVTNPGAIAKLAGAPKHLFLAGALIAFYVLSITWIAPTFGVGNAVFFVLIGQLVAAALIDHFGLFGNPVTQVSPIRLAGIALMGLGVFVTQQA